MDFDLTRYQFVPLVYSFDVKFNGRRRVRLVSNGDITIGPGEAEGWSGLVSIDTMKSSLLLAMLSSLKVFAADVSSVYLTAYTNEKAYTRLGFESG